MYRVLIADDDILMQEALKILISRDESFQIVQVVGSGDSAVKACREDAIDIVFMDMLMPGMTGLEASRMIHQSNPEITIYMLSAFSSHVFIRSMARDEVKDVLEKPVTWAHLKKVLENYKTNHEDTVMTHQEELAIFLRQKDFGEFYRSLSGIIDQIYELAGEDSARLIKLFTYIGQNLLDTRMVYDENIQICLLYTSDAADEL